MDTNIQIPANIECYVLLNITETTVNYLNEQQTKPDQQFTKI